VEKKNIENEVIKSPQESFRIEYFYFFYILYIDKAIVKLQNRFEQFKIYEDIFGFLFSIKNLKLLGCVLLKEKCLNLEKVFET